MQRPRSFWPALRIETSGKVQISEHAQRIRFVFSGQSVTLDSECAQSDGKSWKSVTSRLVSVKAVLPNYRFRAGHFEAFCRNGEFYMREHLF